MKITFVNVGYGECILVEVADPSFQNHTFTMLIDGGSKDPLEYKDPSSGRLTAAEYMASIGLDHLDLMICTHIHEDHICGLVEIAKLYHPKYLWRLLPERQSGSLPELDVEIGETDSQKKFLHALNDYQKLCACVKDQGGILLSLYDPKQSGRIEEASYKKSLSKYMRLLVLGPEIEKLLDLSERLEDLYQEKDQGKFLEKLDHLDRTMNNRSLLLRLEENGRRVLLPGDTNRSGFSHLLAEELRADIYKVGHHGQVDGVNKELLEEIKPELVVCCASSDRRYNSAHPDLLAMIRDQGARLYYSDCPEVGEDLYQAPSHHGLVIRLRGRDPIQLAYV